ncbi:lipopolysaccharide biosynthesis protein [Staphylococcus xylosus]|uniref:lipopolysaccharide biosynthesis protein n=1 Tax=Staphylococcus xylosus TaxID=1288 RepID=UPI000348E6F2|nr:oligosaccharide flippase family protein [Staphylococcus xylosus]
MKKFKNIGYTFGGNVVFAFIKWLILILIVRFTTPEEVGNYTFAVALTTPILLFANMRLRLRYVVEDKLSFKSVKLLRDILNVFCIILIFIIGLVFFQHYIEYIVLVAIIKVLDLQSEIYYSILHKKQNFKIICLMQLGKSIIIIITFFLILILTENILLCLIIQISAQILWLYMIEKKSIKYIEFEEKNINKKFVYTIFLTGIPLGIVQLLNSYNILIPRYVIESILSIKMVGIFASISYLLTIIDLFMNAISQNIIVNIKNNIGSGNFTKLRRFINKDIFIVSIVLVIVLIMPIYFTAKPIIHFVYGNMYAEHSNIFTIVAISIIFNFQSWIFDTVLMAFKVYKIQLITSIITLLISVITSLIMINNYGLLGAAMAVVLIAFSQSVIKYLIVIYLIKKEGIII